MELSILRPRLPAWLEWVRIEHVRLGEAEADLLYQRVGDRTGVDVLDMRGRMRVVFADTWPR